MMQEIRDTFNHPLKISIGISLVFYLVGAVGIQINPTFAQLTPFHLLLNFALFLYSFKEKNTFFAVQLLILMGAGFLLEMMGVKTGAIFGKYTYLENLGPKIANTPVLIGVNWVLVSFSSIGMVHWLATYFKIKLNQLTAAIAGGLLMVITDLFIEPLAPSLGFWEWENGIIPIQNYTAWFFFGLMFCYWIIQHQLHDKSKYVLYLYCFQLVFFISLYF
jgi:putative membrane protein